MPNDLTATFYPDQGNFVTGATGPTYTDAYGNLAVRGPVITDEGSFRTDFTTESTTSSFAVALTGTLTFANGSTAVTGTGTSFQQQVRQGQYVKLASDSETAYAQVFEVNSETSLTLLAVYSGSSASGASVVSNWKTSTPAGGFTYGGSTATTIALTGNTTAGAGGYIQGPIDALPISVSFYAEVSASEVNAQAYCGLQDIGGATPNQAARFLIGGTATSTQVTCVTQSSTNTGDITSVVVTIPNGGVVTTYHLYKIDLTEQAATFSIDGIVVATLNLHLPAVYQPLYQLFGIYNSATGPASALTATIDMALFDDVDRLQVSNDFPGQPLPVLQETLSGEGVINSALATVVVPTIGMSVVTAYHATAAGAFVGTIAVQGQSGDGNWTALRQWSTGNNSTGGGLPGQFLVYVGGFTQIRYVANTYTSGSATITWHASPAVNDGIISYLLQELNTPAPGEYDVVGQLVTTTRVPQITTKFYQQPPSSFLNITTSGGASATQGGTGNCVAVFQTGTAATAEVTGQTFVATEYATNSEVFATQSALFTTPTSAASYQRLGIYNTTDGFSWGYNGLTFGIWLRFNSVDTFIPQTQWNTDTLSGSFTSLFTNGGTPTSLVPTDFNMYRIRYAWYGSTDAFFEVYSPDGNWVIVHKARFANTQITANLTNPNLPLTIDVSKTAADATNLIVQCSAWGAGISAPVTGPVITGELGLSALNASLELPMIGEQVLAFNITGTWVGTLSFQSSLDGVNWVPTIVFSGTTASLVSSTTTNGGFVADVAGFKYFQIIVTAYTSGTATVTYNASAQTGFTTALSLITDGAGHLATVKAASTAAVAADQALVVALSPNSNTVQGQAAAGAAVAGNPVLLGASDGTNAQTLRANPVANGIESLQVQNSENERPTYFITLQGFATGATNTDVFNLIGSATKVVRVTRIRFSMTVTTAVTIPLQLIKRSTANTFSTGGVAVNGAYDSTDPAATATNFASTANPTALGTVVGTAVRSDKYAAQVAPITGAAQVIDWIFGENNCKPPVLRGVAQSLCVNLGGAAVAGGNVSILIEWTEDNT